MTKVERAQLVMYTEELKNLELPVPPMVQEFYDTKVKPSIGRGVEFIGYIEERNNLLLNRVFCFQLYGLRGHEATMREISRRYENGKTVYSNIATSYFGIGTRYVSDDYNDPYDMHESGWSPSTARIVDKNRKALFEEPYQYFNEDEWIAKYPYCAWDNYKGHKSFFVYLSKYRANPKTELLVKAGYSNFVGSTMLNTNGKTFKEIFKVKQDFAEEYLKSGTVTDLKYLRANEWITDSKVYDNFKLIKNREYVNPFEKKYYGNRNDNPLTDDEIKYLSHNGGNYYSYKDYLRFAKELGYPMEEARYHYPKNIKKAHDEAEKKIKDIKDKKKDEQIAELSKACQGYSFEQDGYTIFPLTCAEDLINESKGLHHCVRTYVDDVARHESLILFVRKSDNKDTPFVTVELVKGSKSKGKDLMKQFNKITQVYGYKDSEPDANTSKFVMAWKEKFGLKGWSYKEA